MILCVLVLLPLVKSHAQKTVDIYILDELVVNQSPEVRRKAASEALKTVLIRLSGDNKINQSPKLKSAINNATDYLDRYSYQSTDKTLTIAGAKQSATLLSMQFSANALKALLKQSALPIWSESRPEVLIWAASDRRGKKYVGNNSSMAKSLRSGAATRGLPIIFPVLDLEDRSALPVERLWALDDAKILAAAKRYDSNAVLSGRFSVSNKKWTGSFILVHRGKTSYLTAEGKNRWAVARSIINKVSDYFADIYAINFGSPVPSVPAPTPPVNPNPAIPVPGQQVLNPSALPASVNNPLDNKAPVDASTSIPRVVVPPVVIDDPRTLFLQIDNVNDFNQYIAIMNYLELSPLVDSVKIAKAKRPVLILQVQLLTDKEKFFAMLDLDNRLQRIASKGNNFVENVGQYAIEFVWR